jgi:hypothetical protein
MWTGGPFEDGDNHSSNGWEPFTTIGSQKKTKNNFKVWYSVPKRGSIPLDSPTIKS